MIWNLILPCVMVRIVRVIDTDNMNNQSKTQHTIIAKNNHAITRNIYEKILYIKNQEHTTKSKKKT